MIDEELLSILACPETHQPLARAEAALLEKVNGRISAGGLQNRGGKPVAEPLAEGLVRQDGRIVYPVREGIPFLLVEEGIEVPA